MIIYGKLEATYIATRTVASKTRTKKNKNSDGEPFQITELNNIKDSEVREITAEEEKNISRLNATFRLIGNATFNRSTIRVNTLQNTIELYDLDWNSIELFKTSIVNMHKTSKGYYNRNFIDSPLLDNLFALIFNVFIYPIVSIFSKKILPKTKDVFVGHLESEFKCTIAIAIPTEIENSLSNNIDTILEVEPIDENYPITASDDAIKEQERIAAIESSILDTELRVTENLSTRNQI